MERYYHAETNEKCKAMILEDAQLINYLAASVAVTRHFYLIFEYQGTSNEFSSIAKELDEQAETAFQYLDYCGLEVLKPRNYYEFLLKTVYTSLHKQAAGNIDFDVMAAQIGPVCGDPNTDFEQLSPEEQDGAVTIQDILSPNEIDTRSKEYVLIDGVYHTYLYISGYSYPTEICYAWLSPLAELGDGISLSFFLDKKRKEQILPKVSKTTMFRRSRLRDVGDTRMDYEELDDAISAGLYIKNGLNRDGEEFYYMHTLIEVTALDTETLSNRVLQVQNLCSSMDMTVRRADWYHEQCFKNLCFLSQI